MCFFNAIFCMSIKCFVSAKIICIVIFGFSIVCCLTDDTKKKRRIAQMTHPSQNHALSICLS